MCCVEDEHDERDAVQPVASLRHRDRAEQRPQVAVTERPPPYAGARLAGLPAHVFSRRISLRAGSRPRPRVARHRVTSAWSATVNTPLQSTPSSTRVRSSRGRTPPRSPDSSGRGVARSVGPIRRSTRSPAMTRAARGSDRDRSGRRSAPKGHAAGTMRRHVYISGCLRKAVIRASTDASASPRSRERCARLHEHQGSWCSSRRVEEDTARPRSLRCVRSVGANASGPQNEPLAGGPGGALGCCAERQGGRACVTTYSFRTASADDSFLSERVQDGLQLPPSRGGGGAR